jgi:hypothetical protein
MKTITIITSTIGLMATLAPSSYGQRFATLYTITGDIPVGLTSAKGALYGATRGGGGTGPGACGTAFHLQPPASGSGTWTASTLYSFAVGGTDACQPASAPVVGMGGALFGTTSQGGAYPPPDFGALYEIQPPASPGGPWTENVLYSFGAPGTDLGSPVGGVATGPNASYYVLGSSGGAYGAGSLDWLQPPAAPGAIWTATLLYSFPAGGSPLSNLAAGPDGALYGTTFGGPGEVFQLAPPTSPGGPWTETVLHKFTGAVDNPIALTVAADGTIYGTAYGYEPVFGSGASAAFQLTPPAAPGGQWTYALLTTPVYTEHLNTPLVLANGNLYGGITTGTGGSVFELQPPSAPGDAWTMTTLHTFTDGQIPSGNLVDGGDGTIYGTAAAAPGQPSGGTVYAITTRQTRAAIRP